MIRDSQAPCLRLFKFSEKGKSRSSVPTQGQSFKATFKLEPHLTSLVSSLIAEKPLDDGVVRVHGRKQRRRVGHPLPHDVGHKCVGALVRMKAINRFDKLPCVVTC